MAATRTRPDFTLTTAIDAYLRVLATQVAAETASKHTLDIRTTDLDTLTTVALTLTGGVDVALDEIEANSIDGHDAPLYLDDIFTAHAALPDGRDPSKTKGSGACDRFGKSVSAFFGTAHERGWITENPIKLALAKPAKHTARADARAGLPLARVEEILATDHIKSARKDRSPHVDARDEAMLRVMTECGLRVSELVDLDKANLIRDDRDRPWLAMTEEITKGRKYRLVPVTADTAALIEQSWTHRPTDRGDLEAMFVSRTYRRLHVRNVQKWVKAVTGGTTPHGLRRTAATILKKQGNLDIHELAEILGHADINTTRIYLEVFVEDLADAATNHPLRAN